MLSNTYSQKNREKTHIHDKHKPTHFRVQTLNRAEVSQGQSLPYVVFVIGLRGRPIWK